MTDSSRSQTAAASEYFSSNRESFLEQLFALLAQRSVSTTGEGIPECAELVRTLLEKAGLRASTIATDGAPMVIGEYERPGNRFTLLLYGHYDVQPADEPEWQSDPFAPTVRDGRIYARGASDNKGQFYAHIAAIASLLAADAHIPVNVTVLLEGEEETGSPNIDSFLQSQRERLAADLVLIADGPGHPSGRPVAVFGARGLVYLEVSLRNAETDQHSGTYGGVTPNPAVALSRLISNLIGTDRTVNAPGFYDRVRAPSRSEVELARAIPFSAAGFRRTIGVRALEPSISDNLEYWRRIMFEPNLNVSGIASGYTRTGMKSVIPSKAVLKLDARLVPDQDPTEIAELLASEIRRLEPEATVNYLARMTPYRIEPSDHATTAVLASLARAWQSEPLVYPSLGGSLPAAGFLTALEAKPIVLSYGHHDQNNHGPNENLRLDHFELGVHSTLEIIAALAELDRNAQN
ncbi:MAG: M20/M25/M40 family metallo-hydrolase [Trueperaceae bacterium]